MSTSIYYPKAPCSLKDIAGKLCPSGFNQADYEEALLSTNFRLGGLSQLIPPNKPITTPNSQSVNRIDTSRLESCTIQQQQTLSKLSHQIGGSAVMGLSRMLWDTKIPSAVGDLNTFGSNGMGAAMAASNDILAAIDRYDQAIKQYEDLKNHRAPPRMVNAAKQRAQRFFTEMNALFHRKSIGYLNNNEFKMRQVTNAAGRKVWESIPVANTTDVTKLANFARFGRVAGPGLIVLDGYLRANKVNHMRKNNDSAWKREAFVQSGAFTAGIIVGAAIGALLLATPVGLAIAIVAGGAAGLGVDYISQNLFGNLYDLVSR